MKDHVTVTGTLTRDGGGFVLKRDDGGRLPLRLARTPVDHVEKRVRLSGEMMGAVLEVTAIARE
ncbi:hypothetical protein GCM10023219_13360 [Stakelama sediminis]|uniref:Uncharacterized protein n=1 Tax=Stakelama sediminis TaxID=463200 RepID=A0A840YWY7_9SPHN|nr:DUF5818 domain-containing protein [Stakelama sediminis]MBB5718062.1 hypothetical protein [Stakelama sediminis]